MPNKPICIIVVPSFNQGHFIRQTIDSLLEQKNVDVKVIVMDGGSSDNTVAIMKKYGKKIEWISKKDNGQSDAINKGLRRALKLYGKQVNTYFAYLNSDDYYQPHALPIACQALSSHPDIHWVVGECEIVDADGRPIQRWIKIYKKLWRLILSWQVLAILNPIPQPAVIMRLSAAAKVGVFNQELRYTMDYEYWLRLWQQCGSPLVIDQTLAAFRIHGQSKGSTQFTKQFAEQYQVAKAQGVNPAWLLLQSMHNKVITFVYSLIK